MVDVMTWKLGDEVRLTAYPEMVGTVTLVVSEIDDCYRHREIWTVTLNRGPYHGNTLQVPSSVFLRDWEVVPA